MRSASLLALLLLVLLAVAACAEGGETQDQPNEDTLRASFIAQIANLEYVENLEETGDGFKFQRPDGSGEIINWQVRLDYLSVEQNDRPENPYIGFVRSRWELNGQPIVPSNGPSGQPISGLPNWILETGVSQDCYALWEPEEKVWGWT